MEENEAPKELVRIRDARADEAEVLTALAKSAKASWGYPEEWLRAWEPELTFTPELLRGNAVWVAEVEGSAQGVIAIAEDADELHLAHLWIAPEAQGKGLGRALVEHAARAFAAHPLGSFRIEADPYAQPFYERLGARREAWVDASLFGTERRIPVLRLSIERVIASD